MYLKKLKFGKIMSLLENNIVSWLACMCQVMDALGKLLSTEGA